MLRRHTIALLVAASAFAGCGGSSDDEARKVAKESVIERAKPVSDFLVTPKAIAATPEGSVRRELLEYWSRLQYQSWSEAVRSYEPGLRAFIGDGRLIRALAGQAATFRSSRPEIVRVATTGDRTVVQFDRVDANSRTPTSLTWREDGDRNYVITHDPFLDSALSISRQQEVQAEVDPTAQKPTKRALQAGAEAARLQSLYADDLQRQRRRTPR